MGTDVAPCTLKNRLLRDFIAHKALELNIQLCTLPPVRAGAIKQKLWEDDVDADDLSDLVDLLKCAIYSLEQLTKDLMQFPHV